MDLFIPLQSVSTLLVFLSPFSLCSFLITPVSSLIFLFAHYSQLTDESCIYTKLRNIAQPCFYGLSPSLFSERRAVMGVSAGGSRHIIHCREGTFFFFFFLPSAIFGSIFKGLDILWFIVRNRYLVFLLFLAQSSPNPWNILSDESNKLVFC